MLKRPAARLSQTDFDRLTLCLNLTQSDQDGEVLAAIRGANRILERNKLTWESVWEDIEHRMYDMVVDTMPTVPEAIAALLAKLKPGHKFRGIIESFQKRWDQQGTLSQKQRDVLLNSLELNNMYLRRKPPSG
jgi:hypothetical protein